MFIGGQITATTEIAAVVVPVAIYFLVLGLLNSRRSPQLLSGKQDFVLLIVALSPLFVIPMLHHWEPSLATVLAGVGIVGGGIAVLVPRGHTWVIYNLPARQGRDAVAQALRSMGVDFQTDAIGFRLSDGNGLVYVSPFPLLRNVSVRLVGTPGDFAARFEAALSGVLSGRAVVTSPMAVSLLLVATAMLVAPLALMAQRVPEIVRLLTHLLP